LLALAPLSVGVASLYDGDVVFGRVLLIVAVLLFGLPWIVFLVIAWIAEGFSAVTHLPVYNQRTGEVTLAGYEPAGTDFPLGGAHATFPASRFEEDKCRRCGAPSSETVIVGTPDGMLCMRHAGWYAKKILVKHYIIVTIFRFFTLVGVVTTGYFAWLWLGWKS